MSLTAEQYIRQVIGAKSSLATANTVQTACEALAPHIRQWAGQYLVSLDYSGSYAKKTAIGSGSDVDLFISLSSAVPETLSQIYDSLYDYMVSLKLIPRKQNVSIGVTVDGIKMDLVPGKRQSPNGNNHSLYKSKTASWTKTNVQQHINLVSQSGRTEEIKAIKIWRECRQLTFPSFNLEMAVIEALRGKRIGNLGENVMTVLQYLAGSFANTRFLDPANTNNIISDDMTYDEKQAVKVTAQRSIQARNWNQIVW